MDKIYSLLWKTLKKSPVYLIIFEYYCTCMNPKRMIKNPLFSLVTSLQTRYSVCNRNTISVVFYCVCPQRRSEFIRLNIYILHSWFIVLILKVPSGQIGSEWEWYHWIGLEKDINRYRFLIFWFQFWIIKKTSKFWAASYKKSNRLFIWITVCIESFLPIGWRTFTCWKIRQRAALFWFGLRDVGIFYSGAVIQRTIGDFPAFLDHGSAEKIAVCAIQTGIRTSRRLDSFLSEAAQNFEVFSKIHN